jgi:hypothetical protein
MAAAPIFVSDFFVFYVLPFLLVFTLTFAILQKTRLLGDEAQRTNLIIGMITGALLIAFPYPRDIVVKLMPYLAVCLTIIFVFMLLYGFVAGKKDGDVLNRGMKIVFGILIGVSLIVVLLMIMGFWDLVFNYTFGGSGGGKLWINALMIGIIAGAIIAVIKGESKSSSSK